MNIPYNPKPIPGPKPWYSSPEAQQQARKALHTLISKGGR